MLNFSNLSLRRGNRLLFERVTFMIHPGQRVGITGANGTGKSSLFAMVRGVLHADSGDFSCPSGWVVAHVAQETPALSRSAIDFVMDGDYELRQVQAQLAKAEAADDGHQQALLHGKLDAIDGYSARSRAARLMQGLGFTVAQEENSVESFSGGWRMRLNLAQALMCRSDCLLLDEPTNHLDLDAVIWLQEWLASYSGTLMLISHDRDFLDTVVNHIAHIERQGVTFYKGNYSGFERFRIEQLAQQQSAFERQQREIAHVRSFVDRFRAKASKAKQAQSRLKTLERMELIAQAHADSPFTFSFREPHKLPNPLLTLESASVGYGEVPLLSEVGLVINKGDAIGLLGANGAGKSTLIKLLAGELPLLSGELIPAKELKLGYFAQHQLEQLHPEESPLLHIQQVAKAMGTPVGEQEGRDYLGSFGFNGDRVNEVVGIFSGGEKARLVLAMLVFQRPNLLLLDEPTNHLDLEMRTALSIAIQDYVGAVVMVSHDRHMLRSVCDRLLIVANHCVEPFDGDLDDYGNWLQQQRTEQRAQANPLGRDDSNSVQNKKQRRQQEAERRKRLQPLTNRLKKLEQQMETLHQQLADVEGKLADVEIYQESKKASLKELLSLQSELKLQSEQTEMEWLEISEELELAES